MILIKRLFRQIVLGTMRNSDIYKANVRPKINIFSLTRSDRIDPIVFHSVDLPSLTVVLTVPLNRVPSVYRQHYVVVGS